MNNVVTNFIQRALASGEKPKFDDVINSIQNKKVIKLLGRMEEIYTTAEKMISLRVDWRKKREMQINNLMLLKEKMKNAYEDGSLSPEMLNAIVREMQTIEHETIKQIKSKTYENLIDENAADEDTEYVKGRF